MENKNKKNSVVKDIAILLSIWGPLLFLVIGGIIWKNDGFEGTIMKSLFPVLFFSILAAYVTFIILSNIFKETVLIWYVGAIIIFIVSLVCYHLKHTYILIIGGVILGSILCVILFIYLIKSLKYYKKK